jgi:regulator of cell morphogenesis and NO signaling
MIASADTTIGEIVTRFPQTICLLRRLHIEFCCDGERSLGELCRERRLSLDDLVVALSAAVSGSPRPRDDWPTRPLSDLTAHLVETFHEPLRHELPDLRRMARRVQRHRDSYRIVLAVLLRELERFSEGIESHIAREERELFPIIHRAEDGQLGDDDATHFCRLHAILHADNVETALALRILDNVIARGGDPADACITLRRLLRGLKDLVRLMQLYFHLENNLLLPRAAALISMAGSRRSS